MTLVHPRAVGLIGLAGALLAGCQSAPPLMPHWSLERLESPVVAPAVQRAVAPGPLAPPAPAAERPAVAGGGSAASPGEVGGLGDGYLLLPGGRRLPLPAADEVALPALAGDAWSYFAPGRVPVTLAGAAGLSRMHPRATAPAAEPAGRATLTGLVSPAAPGVFVGYFTREGALAATTTDEAGRFTVAVSLAVAGSGLLVARTHDARPRLAAMPLALAPGESQSATLTLAEPVGDVPAPRPPSGLALAGSALEFHGDSFGAVLWAGAAGAAVPTYAEAPGLAGAFSAESAEGDRGAAVVGAGGPPPEFLSPPDLSHLPDPLTDAVPLSWPAVAGADLYTLRLDRVGAAAALWEGASPHPSLRLPPGLDLEGALVLTVTAWRAEGVNIYSVAAAARQLRLPAGDVRGAYAWARRTWNAAPKATPAI